MKTGNDSLEKGTSMRQEGPEHKDTWHLRIISCMSGCLESRVCVDRRERRRGWKGRKRPDCKQPCKCHTKELELLP